MPTRSFRVLFYTHLQGSMCVISASKIMIPVSPHDSHVCAYIADVIYLTSIFLTHAENLTFLPKSLSLSESMRWSISFASVAMLSTDSRLLPCQIEYVIVIVCSSFVSLFIRIIIVGIREKVKHLACGVGHTLEAIPFLAYSLYCGYLCLIC